MTICNVFFSCVNEDKSRFKLKNAWVYWMEAGVFQVLRSDEEGLVFAYGTGDRTRIDAYTDPFTTTVGAEIEAFYSDGARPLPESIVSASMLLYEVPLSLSAELASLGPVYASSDGRTVAVRRLPLGEIKLPRVRVRIDEPADEPALWPLLWENLNDPDDDYYTDGIPQQAGWHTQTAMQENAAAAAVAAAADVRLRGLVVSGVVPGGSTGATIQIIDTAGDPIPLLDDGADASSAQLDELPVTLGAVTGNERPFSANLFLPATAPLGMVHVVIKPEGLPNQVVAGFSYYLVGAQIGLVDDFSANPDGRQAGPPLDAGDEVYVVDYSDSPTTGPTSPAGAAERNAQRNHTRARRMVRYAIRTHHTRSLSLDAVAAPAMPASSVDVPTTQMPFWMAELQIIGINRSQMEDLLIRRLLLRGGDSGADRMEMTLEWALEITWEGPDRGLADGYRQPAVSVRSAQTVAISLDETAQIPRKHLQGATEGVISNAIQPTAAALSYPVAGRRAAAVRIADDGAAARRPWGRGAGAQYDALAIQWQPPITDDATATGNPIIRGGDGYLRLTSLELNGQSLNTGLIFPRPTPSPTPAPAAPPTGAPVISLPRFRVHGVNPEPADIDNIINAYAEECYRVNVAGSVWLRYLSLDSWQETARRVVGHETGHRQYATPPNVGVRRFGRSYHGYERDMPIFGPPRGYGLGQLDPPGNADRVWNIEANVRRCVEILLIEKGRGAHNHLGLGAPPLSQRDRATFHRETVRRYNGGREFIWNAATGSWRIRPNVVSNLGYVNNVLGTAVVYPQAADTTTEVDFVAADYYPGI